MEPFRYDDRSSLEPMIAEILTVLVAATLLILIVAMVRQRDAAPGSRHRAGSATDSWSGGARKVPSRPAAVEVSPPPREPDAAGRQVIEHLRRLEERAAPGLAAQVMPVFLRDTATRLESLREAVRQRDGVAAHRVAHTLHGSAATVGAATMVHACAEIIREVRLGAFDGCDRLLGELDQDFESIRRVAESLRI
jgi:HPt (histidine-containing phosphotransfer) domain-containing protein